ncbi:hypothetical protein ACLIBG_14480 [Virgibacillus sp. W0181]|uniref:hypothetical protein n=1 Tax=Virgibacillus sp. W0181 TaxID=3391581 RepID=UPI003F471046
MRLLNVRRGQFVYYNNQLHKVYGITPFFKRSVHLFRLEDFKQQLATANEIDYYKPKHLDSFVCNHHRYTLDKDAKARVGDYILVINPKPDSLDHHHLNSIEMVSSIEKNGVISNKSNGIKHSEYWVMVPGLIEGATIIGPQRDSVLEDDQDSKETATVKQTEVDGPGMTMPRIGDVFQKNDADPIIQTMVIAVAGRTIYLGGGFKVDKEELADKEIWSYVLNAWEQ